MGASPVGDTKSPDLGTTPSTNAAPDVALEASRDLDTADNHRFSARTQSGYHSQAGPGIHHHPGVRHSGQKLFS